MDTKQLNEALSKIYDEEHQRVVFWNDPQQEFDRVAENLDLDGVNVVRLDQVGGIETKLRIEREEPDAKFLLYAPTEEPEFEDDILLDVRLYSRSFRADRSSIILDELGLARQHLRSHLNLRRKFFDSKERLGKLKHLVNADDNELDLDRKMLAVVTKADQPELFSIVRTLFQSFTEEEEIDLETPPPAWTLIEKYDLDRSFWKMVSTAFGYEEESPTLQKLLLRLMLSDFAHQLGIHVPLAIQKLQLSRSGTHNAVVCLDQWRDSAKQASSFNILSDMVAGATNIDEQLQGLEPEVLADAVTFRNVDRAILLGLLERVASTKDHVDADAIRGIVTRRQEGHWIASLSVPEHQRKARHAAYEAIAVAAEFFDLRAQHSGGFDCDTAEEMYTLYTDELYKFDQLYRHFCHNADVAESQAWDILKSLRKEVEAAYKNWFLVQVGLKWAKFVAPNADHTGMLDKWTLPHIPNQYRFYEKHVAERQRESENRRSFVVISDAFRYEAATELTKILNGEYRFQAKLTTQLSVLPSYTALGMASMLPHKQLEYTEKGDVLADGVSTSGSDNRNTILSKHEGMAIQADDLLKLKGKEGRALIEGKKVVYVYHNEIDTRGENAATEGDTFRATHEAIRELGDIVRYIINNLNGNYVVVTADHGFLFTESSPAETDKSKLKDKPPGTVKAKKRYLIGYNLPEYEDAWRGKTEITAKCDGGMEFWIPKGSNRFHFTGGARFIHGGAMPQEIVVPVITVRQAKSKKALEKTKTKQVSFSVLGSNHKITTHTHRFKLIQMEPVSDRAKALTVKIAIYDGDEPVSSIETVTFASASKNLDDRQQSVMLTLRDQQFDKHKRYKLLAKDAGTDFELQSHDVTIDRAIADDFDF
ncbi:PglZ domain protein [Stieleria neptunia]|uniref:PglZ domain protein n=1 Tax=Stieleria neptunia TaxID=2527979 RepID=A0A518HSY6_9BACT|nr:BREX-1 system phosphatase PglZ type A [Stieleria neptunia]QDV43924.1 PglZ domain protein [Stieleria neptunia]